MTKIEKNKLDAALKIFLQLCEHNDCFHCPLTLYFKPCVECPVETVASLLNQPERSFDTCKHVVSGLALGRHEFTCCEITHKAKDFCNCEDCPNYEQKEVQK